MGRPSQRVDDVIALLRDGAEMLMAGWASSVSDNGIGNEAEDSTSVRSSAEPDGEPLGTAALRTTFTSPSHQGVP
jgi:hypothetical protein